MTSKQERNSKNHLKEENQHQLHQNEKKKNQNHSTWQQLNKREIWQPRNNDGEKKSDRNFLITFFFFRRIPSLGFKKLSWVVFKLEQKRPGKKRSWLFRKDTESAQESTSSPVICNTMPPSLRVYAGAKNSRDCQTIFD